MQKGSELFSTKSKPRNEHRKRFFCMLIYVISNLLLILLVHKVEKSRTKLEMNLSTTFLFFFQLYFIYVPCLQQATQSRYNDDIFWLLQTLLSLSSFLFALGTISYWFRHNTKAVNIINNKFYANRIINFSLTTALALIMVGLGLHFKFGSLLSYYSAEYITRTTEEGALIKILIYNFSINACLLITSLQLARRPVWATIITVVSVLFVISLGKRMPALEPVFAWLFCIFITGSINIWMTYLIISLLLFGGIAYGHLRPFINDIFTNFHYASFTQRFKNIDWTHSEFAIQFENFYTSYLSFTSGQLLYGTSFLNAFKFLLPGSILDRGSTLSEQFMLEHFADLALKGEGRGYSLTLEFLANFGNFFPVLFFALGLLYAWLWRKFCISTKSIKYFLLIPLIPTFALLANRVEFVGILKNIEIYLTLTIIALTLTRNIKIKAK